MRFEIHAAGIASAATLLAAFDTFADAAASFAGFGLRSQCDPWGRPGDDREPWAIIPTGRTDELASLGGLYSIAPRYSGGCYVLSAGDGVSCLGFTVAERKRAAVAAWLAKEGAPRVAGFPACCTPGTPEAFARYRATMDAARAFHERTGRRCDAELTPALVGLEGKRVEVTAPGKEARRFIVGKSTGWMPCHLEIATRRSHGGGPAYVPEGAAVRVIEGGRR